MTLRLHGIQRNKSRAGVLTAGAATVCFVGGEDVHLRIPLLRELRRRGLLVSAVGSEAGEAFAAEKIPYFRYTLGRWVNPAADLRSRRQLVDIFSLLQPDVVHAFDTKPSILAPLAARSARVPIALRTITGMGYLFSSASPLAGALRPIYRSLHRRAAQAARMTVFQNHDDREYFRRYGMVRSGEDQVVLGSGIDLDAIARETSAADVRSRVREALSIPLDAPVVIMVARLVVHKGVREFLAAAEKVQQERSDAVFLLVGPLASEGRQAVPVQEIQSARAVRWLGPRDDVVDLLRASDLFTLPTYYREGVPRVLLEAAAVGLPLVATDMPGCREVVRDGENGRLIAPRSAESLARVLHELLAARSTWSQLGESGRRHVHASFSLQAVADSYAKLYRRLGKQAETER